MNQPALSLAGAIALSSAAAAQDPTADMVPFDRSNVTYIGVYDLATGTITNPAATRGVDSPRLGDPIYDNTAPTGFFLDCVDGRTIIDEGRIPGTTSPGVIGTQDSYGISSLQIGYVTDAMDPSLGGTGVSLEVKLYESIAGSGLLEATDVSVATLEISGLPGSRTGDLAGFLLDIDVSGAGICMRADGGGGYVDGASDRFGWSMRVSDPADSTQVGPFVSGPSGPLDSFYMVVRSDLGGGCMGCGVSDDRFEPNDEIASASPLEIEAYGGLVSDGVVEDDYYSFTVPGGAEVVVDAIFEHAVSDLDLVLYRGGAIVETGFSSTDDERVSFGNGEPDPVELVVRVNNFGDACNEYDLDLSFNPLFADDALEGNDDCASAVPLALGVTRDLVVRSGGGSGGGEDADFYSYGLADGETLTVDILFVDAAADIDLILYDVSDGGSRSVVAGGFSTTDNERVEFTNASGGPLDLVVRVDFFSGVTTSYDLVARAGPATMGEIVCIGEENSTGAGARLWATGSDVASDNDVTLEVDGLPANTLGFFVVAREMGSVVGTGAGEGARDLCLGGLEVGRYSMSVLDSGATGAVSFRPDLTAIPVSMRGGERGEGAGATVPAMAGDTFYWQHWTRDVGGEGAVISSSSDGLKLHLR